MFFARTAGLVVSPSHSVSAPRSCSRSRSLSLPPSLSLFPFLFLSLALALALALPLALTRSLARSLSPLSLSFSRFSLAPLSALPLYLSILPSPSPSISLSESRTLLPLLEFLLFLFLSSLARHHSSLPLLNSRVLMDVYLHARTYVFCLSDPFPPREGGRASLPFTFLPFLSCVPPLFCPPLLPRSSLPYSRLHLGHGAQEPLLAAGPDPREELPQPAAALPVPCLSPFRRRWHGPARCSRDTVVAIPAAARASQPSFGRLGAWTEGGGGGGKGGGGQSVCPCQTVRRERLRIGQAARHGCREGKWVRAARLLDRRCSRGTPPPALSGRGSHSNRHGVIKAYEEEVNQHFEEFEDPRCPSNQAIAAG